MRYKTDNRGDAWLVLEEDPSFQDPFQYGRAVTGYCTEAEANIIAFALNAIVNDHSLLAVTGGQVKDWQAYSGPTEGVKP